MTQLLVRKLLGLILTLFGASLVVFVVMEVLPGDPAAIILGTGAQPDTLATLRTELGLDRPAPERLLDLTDRTLQCLGRLAGNAAQGLRRQVGLRDQPLRHVGDRRGNGL